MSVDGRLSAVLILGTLFIIIVALLFLGWRSKRRAQSGLIPPESAVGVQARETDERWSDVHYVATTPADVPLERIVIGPLGFRGRCDVVAGAPGLVVTIAGGEPFLIPWSRVEFVGRATATIDRVVEQDGLSVVRWSLETREGERAPVDTVFRFVDRELRAQFDAAVTAHMGRGPEQFPQTTETRESA